MSAPEGEGYGGEEVGWEGWPLVGWHVCSMSVLYRSLGEILEKELIMLLNEKKERPWPYENHALEMFKSRRLSIEGCCST